MRTSSVEEKNVRQVSPSADASTGSQTEKFRSSENLKEPSGGPRGFAALSPIRRREIASLGGQAAHVAGVAHEFSSKEAREAGRKGGAATSRDRAHMAAIGRIGVQRRVQRQNEVAR